MTASPLRFALATFCTCALACLLTSSLAAAVPAFPGAEGYGAITTGGRGGAVIEVTNLNDSGTGSLRAALGVSGPRTIVFRVGGTIELQSTLKISRGDVTIAGQTAPGDGITLANYTLQVSANNVIIRFLRVRVGDLGSVEGADGRDAIFARDVDRLIIDHVSCSWSIDETISVYRNTNTTVQWTLATESLNLSLHSKEAHGYGGIWGGNGATFHHNLFAHHMSRNPRFNGNGSNTGARFIDVVDMRNCVIYNWGSNSCYGGEPTLDGVKSQFNMVGNYFKAGPATPSGTNDRITTPDDAPNGSFIFSQYYIADNVTTANEATTANNALGVDNVTEDQKLEILQTNAFTAPAMTQQPADQAYLEVLQYGGCVFPARDSVDVRIMSEVANGTTTYGNKGIINSQSEVGGFPVQQGGVAPVDSDHDGMPDAWELAHGLNPNDAADRNGDFNGDGYTNLEDYLNGLVAHTFPPRVLQASAAGGSLQLNWENFPNDSRLQTSPDGSQWTDVPDTTGSWGSQDVPVTGGALYRVSQP